jgi:hypothetical protein
MSCFNLWGNAAFIVLSLSTVLHAAENKLADSAASESHLRTNLLVVGGTESGWAAAIQAARLGVPSITMVHDGSWLGGQFTEQGLACVDENMGVGVIGWGPDWHPMKRSFHRFGLFKELMDRIEIHNTQKYGSPMPGKPHHGPTTFRPAEAEAIFREMLEPYVAKGQIVVKLNFAATRALKTDDGRRVVGMVFQSLDSQQTELTVDADLTIDASDWGDAVQLSGTEYEVGPDPRSRYGEPSAQVDVSINPPNEMNPITWTLIVEQNNLATPIPPPANYDVRQYLRATTFGKKELASLQWECEVAAKGPIPWPPGGAEAARQSSILTMRRIVDGTASIDGVTAALICYSHGQDYPLERLPRRVIDALEATEVGASIKNIVLMTRQQRQIIFEDAKRHSLGLLYHLQTYVHDRVPDKKNSLRNYQLSGEFGTPDNLPPKPYIRESLRLKALTMMREQDGLTAGGTKTGAQESFASVMYPDGVFSWQFHYDFHDTGRAYLSDEGDTGPWVHYEKPGRGVHNLSDRSVFPVTSLVPIEMDGLIGAQGNVGFSSIVSSAVRLHDQRIHIGQAAAALAATSLKHQVQPRVVASHQHHIEEIRHALCGGTSGEPILLWPYRDLPTNHSAFVAINRLAARRLLPVERAEVDFLPDEPATQDWQEAVLSLCRNQMLDLDLRNRKSPMTRGDFAIQVWQAIENSGN